MRENGYKKYRPDMVVINNYCLLDNNTFVYLSTEDLQVLQVCRFGYSYRLWDTIDCTKGSKNIQTAECKGKTKSRHWHIQYASGNSENKA